jgi:hypothetical protein
VMLRWDGNAWSSIAHPHFPGNHLLYGADAPDSDDAWAVGFRLVPSGGGRTVVEHWDGTAWNVVHSPNPNPEGLNQLSGVKAVPFDRHTVWAVGSYTNPAASFGDLTLTLRRTSGRWRVVSSPNVTVDNHLEAVDATGPDDTWAVGWGSTSQFGGKALAIVLHWDGTRWTEASIPEPEDVMLFGVRALTPDDVWAVGHTYIGGPHWIPLVLHWDGVSWSRSAIPETENGGQLRDIVSLSGTDVYAVGFTGEGTFAETLALHWNGTSWSRQPTPNPGIGPKIFGAAALDPSTVWAVGYRYNPNLFVNQTMTLRSRVSRIRTPANVSGAPLATSVAPA